MRWIGVLLVGSLLLNAILFVWYWGVSPVRRSMHVARLVDRTWNVRPVVLIGDSILEPIETPPSVRNVSVPGATVGFVRDEVIEGVLALRPRRVVIALGINDLRYGIPPDRVADEISQLVGLLLRADPSLDVVVLSILPFARDTPLTGETDNAEIIAANAALRTKALSQPHGFVDYSGLLSVSGALDDDLTHDGLHLNRTGLALLSRLLFSGIAMDGA